MVKYSPLATLLIIVLAAVACGQDVSFSRDILPILSDRCFNCHGPAEAQREADLRLDLREHAMADLGGYAAIVPGDPEKSELLSRIASDDSDLVMPPPDSNRPFLDERERELIQRWIAEGAEWGRHWSFVKPERPNLPINELHPIDAFVESRLRQQGRSLAKAAPRHTLLRRMSFDLTGLPPTIEELDNFLKQEPAKAYNQAVDRLLSSPHYGERMAMWWLDAARYSDTDGYQQDATRTNWPWRDWVISAFNQNLSFDEFTKLQFAGDLLPQATADQVLATCFHRNHMTNGEGGRHPEESRVDYVIDRVNTMGTVWLGLTLGCCQCHSHKFDPITQKDYYSLSAFFNSLDEDGKAGTGAKPFLQYQSPLTQDSIAAAEEVFEKRKSTTEKIRQSAESSFRDWLSDRRRELRDGFEPWKVLQARQLRAVEGTRLTQLPNGTIQASGPNPRQDDYIVIGNPDIARVTGLRLEVFPHEDNMDGKLSRGRTGEFILTDVKLQVVRRGHSQVRDVDLVSAVADVEKDVSGRNYGKIKDTLDDDPRNGWTTETHDARTPHMAVFALAEPLLLAKDEQLRFVMLHRSTFGDANIGLFRIAVTDQPGKAVRTLDPMPLERLFIETSELSDESPHTLAIESISDDLRSDLFEQFLEDHATYQKARNDLRRAERQLATVKKAAGKLNVMVMQERSDPRDTHVLVRGVWDNHGDRVTRAFPAAILHSSIKESWSRLDLAQWLVSPENPLTARVVVNQLWQLCFGQGLVRTPDDFGLQGAFPTHPELLDWLAVELIDSGWDLQHILRLIVTSQTYQQSSSVDGQLLETDPGNTWYARGARFRLPSWMIRDAALRSSGLLDPGIGGPPVMPYQPPGVWEENFMGRFRYEPSQGDLQFRRTVYAFWRRASAPTFLFDSAQRRVCEVRPRRTNTPLQALTLMNDMSQLESARQLARMANKLDQKDTAGLRLIFRAILSREPEPEELSILKREFTKAAKHYQSHPADALKLLGFGQPELVPKSGAADVAPYLVVASLIYNLDEAITHE